MQHCVGRKGLAPVVGVALLIALGVIAVVGLGVFVLDLTNKPQLSPAVSCFDAQTESPFVVSAVCYNQTNNVVQIDMHRIATSFAYDSLLFTVEGTTSSSWTCGKGCGLCTLGAFGQSKKYYSLPLDSAPSTLKVLANGCELARAFVQRC